jgi:hypothetical protein
MVVDLDYRGLFQRLNEGQIDYLVVGGLAVNIHGVPRMTYDVDLMVRLEPENVLKLVGLLETLGYRPRVPVAPADLADEAKRRIWIETKEMRAFSFHSDTMTLGEIDIMMDAPFPYPELRQRAILVDLQGVAVPVISLRDLIELKRRSGRRQDLSDVEHLLLIAEGQ